MLVNILRLCEKFVRFVITVTGETKGFNRRRVFSKRFSISEQIRLPLTTSRYAYTQGIFYHQLLKKEQLTSLSGQGSIFSKICLFIHFLMHQNLFPLLET